MERTRIEHDLSAAARGHRTAVSLHSHTHHSREMLGFLPGWASRVPVLRTFVQRELARQRHGRGRTLDFSRAYWCPPLSPRAVIGSEHAQIESRLGLAPLVSITDHDNIDASVRLAALGLGAAYPTSVEWTVPFRGHVFHLGVHNMPSDTAGPMMQRFRAYTARPTERELAEILSWVVEFPSTLVVLNHPLWNAHVDEGQDQGALGTFVRLHRPFLHATEVNGYRSHGENKAALRFGQSWGLPMVAGGDRHGRAPNAMLNLTSASTFDEFVHEVRERGSSRMVIMPEYQEHPATRVLEVVGDVLRHDSTLEPGQQRWTQRVFVIDGEGRHLPLEHFWREVPLWIRAVVRAASMMGGVTARQALRLGLAVEDAGVL